MTNNEKSLLLYLETCAVDHGGAVEGRRMNDEDFALAARWSVEGFITFERIRARDIKPDQQRVATHGVSLSQAAWEAAHKERRARAVRMDAKRRWRTIAEKRAEDAAEGAGETA